MKMSLLHENSSIFDSLIILLINVLIFILFFFVQLALGIGPGEVHIDEKTYLMVGSQPYNPAFCSVGKFYYCLVQYLKGDLSLIIIVNVIAYFFISFVLIKKLLPFSKENHLSFFLFLLIVFDPYRMHLALHVLKETLLIFCLILFFSNSIIIKFFSLVAGVYLRIAFPIYIFLNKRINFRIILLLILILLTGYIIDKGLMLFVLSGSQPDMIFREYDRMPTFNEYGFLGDVLRATTWPFLFISGLFIFISPSAYFYPIFFCILIYNLYIIFCLKKFPYTIGAIASLSILAFLVPGFTSYIRYVYPILVALPLIHIRSLNLR